MQTIKKSTKWIKTNFSEADVKRRINVRGRDIEVFISPYEIPEAIRLSFDKTLHTVTIEFRYVAEDEPSKVMTWSDGNVITLGKLTGRIYQIELKLSVGEADHLKVLDALDKLFDSKFATDDADNVTFIREALRSHRSKLHFA